MLGWRRGEHQLTPLHEAARDNLASLARLLLKQKPDLTAVDSTFGGTAMDWAQQCGSQEVLKAIEKSQEAGKKKGNQKKGKGKGRK